MTSEKPTKIYWKPQPRQLVALKACGLSSPFDGSDLKPAIADIIGYGGAAGGGKTDTLLSIAFVAGLAFPGINIAYFRREFPQLEGVGGAISRSLELISHLGKYNAGKHVWKMFNGSTIQFSHCNNPKDVYSYQSQQIDVLLIDESTQFTQEMIDYLITRNRKTIKSDLFVPFTVLATNPGNIGHAAFKERFIDIGKYEELHEFTYETGIKLKHFFIQSHLSDNQKLVKRDPGYEVRLSTNELNRKMLLEGEWDVYQGQAFSECRRDIHLTKRVEITEDYRLFGAYDHGFSHPYSFGVFAVDGDGSVSLVAHSKDRLLRPDQIARKMASVYDLSKLEYIVAGHDCWTRGRDGAPTVAEQFRDTPQKIMLTKAKIDRAQGAAQVRNFLAWKETREDDKGDPIDGEPKFTIFEQFSEVYDTVAGMIFNPDKPEDVLKVDANSSGKGGDDDYDMVRYGLMSRPRPLPEKEIEYPDDSGMAILNRHLEQKRIQKDLERWR